MNMQSYGILFILLFPVMFGFWSKDVTINGEARTNHYTSTIFHPVLHAQDRVHTPVNSVAATGKEAQKTMPVKSGSLHSSSATMWVILIIWLGISAYLFTIDLKIRNLERKISEK